MVKPLFKGGKARAITFSFDDGKPADKRLIEIFNKYSLKATFNLNGGRCRNPQFQTKNGEYNEWNGSKELQDMYKGHEIASHSYTHKRPTELSDEDLRLEVRKDVSALSRAFGTEIHGYASPQGDRDERLPKILKESGIRYQRYTCREDTCKPFSLPDDFLKWQPNPHFSFYATKEGKRFINDFFECSAPLPCLMIWGHSYELEELNAKGFEKWNGLEKRWEYFDSLCEYLSGRADVWYAANIEICDYVTNMRKAHFDDTYIDNPTDTPLYFDIDGRTIVAPPHTRFGV